MGKKERRSEWNGARRMDGRWGVWGKAERWSYHREGQERHDRLSSEDSLSLMEGYYCMCLGDSELGYLLLQGGGATPGRDHPTGGKNSPSPGLQAALTTGRGCGAAGASHHISQTGTGVVT